MNKNAKRTQISDRANVVVCLIKEARSTIAKARDVSLHDISEAEAREIRLALSGLRSVILSLQSEIQDEIQFNDHTIESCAVIS